MTSGSSSPIISFNPVELREKFEREYFLIQHNLAENPLFTLEKLIEAGNHLPLENLEFNAGDVPISALEDRQPTHRLSVEDTIRNISEYKTWLGLKKVERLPAYKQVIDGVLDALKPEIDKLYPGMYDQEGFIFVTSPNSMTPYHMDPEHNFLLQIQGEKLFTIFDKFDRSLVTEEQIEQHYSQLNRKMALAPDFIPNGTTVTLRPGDGMHVPINAPHYVRTGSEVSVSISITFRSPRADRREAVYKVNRKIRKFNVRPAPFGESPWRDQVKASVFELYARIRAIRDGVVSFIDTSSAI